VAGVSAAPPGLPPAGRFALCAALVSSFGQTFFIGLFGADFRADFGLSEAALGAFYGSATLASGLLMFWLGSIADHWLLRRAIVFSTLLLATGAALIGLAGQVWMLVPGLFLLRLGGQGLSGHLAVVAAARYARRRRGRAVAMASYGFILGEASFPLIVALVLGVVSWQQLWLLAAGVLLLVALPALYALARQLPVVEVPASAADGSTTAPPLMKRHRLFLHGGFLRVLSIVLLPPVLITAVFLHQGTLAELLAWERAEIARGFVLFAAAQALMAFSGGRLIDRFSARWLLRFALLPAALGMLGLGLLPPGPALWLMFAGLGMTAGLNGVISGAVWVELFGTAQLGMIRGVYAAVMVVSTALGPVLLGWLLGLGVSLLTLGLAVVLYATLAPALAVPGIRGFAARD